MATELRGQPYQKYLVDVMMLYKQRRDLKAYLEILLSLLAIGMFIVFAIKPTLVTIGDLVTKINSEQQTSDALDTKIKNLGTAQSLFNSEEDKINLLPEAIPDEPAVSLYVRQLESYAQKENLTILAISVSKIDLLQSTPSGQLETTFSVTGDYNSLQNFNKDVENLRRPAIISKLDMIKDDKGITLTITPEAPYAK